MKARITHSFKLVPLYCYFYSTQGRKYKQEPNIRKIKEYGPYITDYLPHINSLTGHRRLSLHGTIVSGANSYTLCINLYSLVLNNWKLKHYISNVKINNKTHKIKTLK
jgi:hypothetical protein